MTAFTNISNALVAVGAKPFATTIQALRDNPLAIAEGDASVPANLRNTVLLGTYTTTSGTTLTLSSLVLTPYRFLRFVWNGVGVSLSTATLSAGGAAITGATVSNTARIRGITDIDLATGAGASNVADVTAAAPAGAASIVFGLRTSLSTASTSVSISSTSAFNAGSVLLYGVK